MSFGPAVDAILGSGKVEYAFLLKFDFVSKTRRVWTGFGTLRTLDGNEWEGLGEILSIEGLSGPLSGSAPAGRLSISGCSPDILAKAKNERGEYKQRPVSIYFQAFQNRIPVSNPCILGLRIMTSMEITHTGATRTISVNHESPYVGRNNPSFGYYTDRDQQSRYDGDRFCERTPFLLFKQERWPDY